MHKTNETSVDMIQFEANLRSLACLILLGSVLVFFGHQANAQNTQEIKVQKAYIVLGPPTIKVHGAYFELLNTAQREITLVGASSNDYRRVKIHRSKVESGVAMMEQVENVTVEAGKSVTFKAGGLHLMLIEPARTMAPNEKVMLTLHLADKRKVTVPLTVMRRYGMASQTAGHGHAKHAH